MKYFLHLQEKASKCSNKEPAKRYNNVIIYGIAIYVGGSEKDIYG